MNKKELNEFRQTVYKNYIKMQYGQEALDKFEVAVNNKYKDKEMNIRNDEDFINKMEELISQ